MTATKLDSSTATDVHNAAHGVITSAPIGSTVHDKALVTGTAAGGTPTGTVTFTVYMGNTTCTGAGTVGDPIALVAGVADPSASAVVPVGGLSYKATYNGSTTYNTSVGACEPLTATKLDSSTATDVHNAAHGVITSAPIGSTVHDKALVTGTAAGGTPTGTVTFTVYMGNTTCTGAGTVGDPIALVAGVADPSASAVVPVGGLSYKATYNGSTTYNTSVGACEPLTATKLDSSTATDVHNAAHGVITSAPIGSTVHDKALVTGTAAGGTPTGTVTFTVYMGNTTCTGAGTVGDPIALVAGVADPSASAVVPVGGLSYKATYNGSTTYNTSIGACEPLTATKLDSLDGDRHSSRCGRERCGGRRGDHVGADRFDGARQGDRDGCVDDSDGQCLLHRVPGQFGLRGSGHGGRDGCSRPAVFAHPSSDATVPVGGLSYRATTSATRPTTGRPGRVSR